MSESERMWEKGWKGHEKAQLRRMAGLPLRDRIRWLEEAQRMVQRMRRRRNKPDKA
jgi:hypothetical protein